MLQPLLQWMEADEVLAIWKEVYDESERGCVLLCAALLDRSLGHCVRLKFRGLSGASDEDIDKVLKDYPMAALLSFTARARVAHLLGLMPKEISLALRQFATLRNVFAHEDRVPKLSVELLQPMFDSMSNEGRQAITAFESMWKTAEATGGLGKMRLIGCAVVLQIFLVATAKQLASQQSQTPMPP